MDIKRVKYNLNRTVVHNGTEYLFTACRLRLTDSGFQYDAELKDLKAYSSVIICPLENIQEIKENT